MLPSFLFLIVSLCLVVDGKKRRGKVTKTWSPTTSKRIATLRTVSSKTAWSKTIKSKPKTKLPTPTAARLSETQPLVRRQLTPIMPILPLITPPPISEEINTTPELPIDTVDILDATIQDVLDLPTIISEIVEPTATVDILDVDAVFNLPLATDLFDPFLDAEMSSAVLEPTSVPSILDAYFGFDTEPSTSSQELQKTITVDDIVKPLGPILDIPDLPLFTSEAQKTTKIVATTTMKWDEHKTHHPIFASHIPLRRRFYKRHGNKLRKHKK